jgi:hypothetical protein
MYKKGVITGHPKIVSGPSGELDAFTFGQHDLLTLGSTGVDTDKTWTVDTYIKVPVDKGCQTARGNPCPWMTLTRGKSGDHQVIVRRSDGQVGSYENLHRPGKSARGFVSAGWKLTDLADGWHRLTVSSICSDGACKTRKTMYYIDKKVVGQR